MKFTMQATGTMTSEVSAILRKADRSVIMEGLTKCALLVERQAKININQVLNTTGESKPGSGLAGALTMEKLPEELVVKVGFPQGQPAKSSGILPVPPYARIHEFGGIIKPIDAEWLVFKVKSAQGVCIDKTTGRVRPTKAGTEWSWVKVKQVTMPARPYLGPALETCKAKFADIYKETLRKIFGKAAEGAL